MSELGKYSPQHRGGIDAGDTDSVDLTPENHGPHRMNRKQTANDYKNALKVPQLLFLTRQNLSNSYPNTATWTSDAVYRIRDADAIFRIERKDGQKIAKNSKLFYTKYGQFTSNHCGSVCSTLWRIVSKYIIFFACFRRFTVGSIKIRQITLSRYGQSG